MTNFSRTTCACAECQECCRRQPGFLVPGDLERIAEHLGLTPEAVRLYFWASPGALVMNTDTGRQFRIGTITPRYDRRTKRCVFLSEAGECKIHPVAPAGCAYFDTHMNAQEGMQRSVFFMRQVIGNAEYKAQRGALPFAEHYKPTK